MANDPKDDQKFDFSDIAVPGAEPGEAPIVVDDSAVDWQRLGQDLEEQQKFGNRPLETAATAAASAATFSASDRLLQKLGVQTQEEQAKLREFNPSADITGTILGTVAPVIATGPAALAGAPVRAAAKAGSAVEKAFLKAAATPALKGTAREIVKKSLAKGAGSAVEGAAFGAGQLLREDALGEAEVNAENLLSYAGTGAAFGGALGTVLPAAGVAAGAVSKGGAKMAKQTFGPLAKKIVDPVEDSMELLGYTPKMKARVLTDATEAETVKDLPRWLREDVGWQVLDNEEARLAKLQQLGETSGRRIDEILNQADEEIASRYSPEQVQAARIQLFRNVANDLETEALERLGSIPSANPARKRLDRLVRNIRTYLDRISKLNQIGKPNMAKELRQLRNEIWDTYKSLPFEERGTQVGSILKNSYRKMAQSLENFAKAASDGLEQELKKANQNYSRFKRFEEPLAKRASKEANFVTFKDLVFGGLGYGAGGVAGLVVAAGKKLLQSDLKKMVTVLASIEKANKQAATKTSKSVANFFKGGSGKPFRAASTAALLSTDLSNERKDRKKAFKEVAANVRALSTDPARLEAHVARATSVLSLAAPETATQAAQKLGAGLQFLASKLPKPVTDVQSLGARREYEPSSMELAKFERFVQAVERPLSVLEDIEQGTLTREHVEALAAVYPRLLQSIRAEVVQQLDSGVSVPYNRRVQLGILLDLPSDPSLQAEAVLQLQSNFAQQQPATAPGASAVKPTQGGAENVNFSQRAQTETERIANKGSE